MKKQILLFAVALGMLTACDPIKEKGTLDVDSYTSSNLLDGAEFSQYADQACTTLQADGNWIKYNIPNASGIYIYYIKADGSEFKLTSGASGGVFNFVPSRGSDPNQTVYFKYVNANLEEVVASKDFTVQVAAELNPEIRLIASNDYGKKTWTWDPSITGAVWGNMGYCGGAGSDVGISGNGQWWGVTSTDEFNQQLQHTHNGVNNGDGDLNAYMVFTEDGLIKSYNADGGIIREGSYEIKDYNPNGEWKVGTLVTDAILWPYEINSNGNVPGTYEICYLTSDKMTLVYPDGGDYGSLGNWGEATFWHFCSNSDVKGMAYGYDNGKSWTWNTEAPDGVVWGNMGYCGGAGANAVASGKWWGVTSEAEFMGQLNHTNDGAAHGDESMNAYMTLTPDGVITRHAGDGSVINTGTFEIDESVKCDWKVANLNTTAGTILFPYEINSGGNMPTTFEMVYLSGNKMTLVYPDGGDFGGLGNWGEATFWQFKAK